MNQILETYRQTRFCQIIKRKNEKENRIVKFNLIDSLMSLMRFQALTHMAGDLSVLSNFVDAELAFIYNIYDSK